jgi:hypothetical protein
MSLWQKIEIDPEINSVSSAPSLPEWFDRPRPARTEQATLFSSPLTEVLTNLRVSADELNRWCENGWVSFGSERSRQLEPWDRDEIQFVRDIVRSGLSDAQIECLFAQLPRPMNFAVDQIAFSFLFGWVAAVPPTPEPDRDEIVKDHLDNWLDQLNVEENCQRLIALRDQIDRLLTAAGIASDEEPGST